jgi:hypothetical protein
MPCHNAEKSGLAATVGADETNAIPFAEIKGDVLRIGWMPKDLVTERILSRRFLPTGKTIQRLCLIKTANRSYPKALQLQNDLRHSTSCFDE